MGFSLPSWQVYSWAEPGEPWTHDHDVVVVGGGLSGVAAAVAAARRGARVVVLEPTHLLGGQMSAAAVGTVDLAPGFQSTVEQGLWGEIADRMRALYDTWDLTTAVARYRMNDSMAVNAPVTDRVLSELCNGAGVEVVRSCRVTGADISSDGAVIETDAGTFRAAVAVEATEDGSLLAEADFPFRAGTQKGRGHDLPGPPTDIQRITQCAVIRRYQGGVPEQLRLREQPHGYADVRGSIRVGYPHMPHFFGRPAHPSPHDFAGYRALPDIADLVRYDALEYSRIRRTSLNHQTDVVVQTDYLTDEDARRTAQTAAINSALSVIWYLQNELGLDWAIAQDEGYRDGPEKRTFGVTDDMPEWVADLPVIPYLRESRRLVGSFTLTSKQISRRPDQAAAWSKHALAVGTYGSDMHGSKGSDDFEADLGEGGSTVNMDVRGPFWIPFGSFVPDDDRRLVAAEKNLSMSRVASSAVRVQPSVTAVGEAAGVIAALAARQDVAPRRVDQRAVQISLLRRGALLLPYPIQGVPAGHRDYVAVALAVLHGGVGHQVDDDDHLVRLSASQLASARAIGAKLVEKWEGAR